MRQWAHCCRTPSIRRFFRERVPPMRFGHQPMTCWTRRAVARSCVPAIAAIVFAGPFQTKPTNGKLLCQGQYSRKNTIRGAANAWLPTDRWRMYMLPDRSYSVRTELEPFDKETSIRQIFTLASDFKPKGFSSNSKWHNISCEFNAASLQCSVARYVPKQFVGVRITRASSALCFHACCRRLSLRPDLVFSNVGLAVGPHSRSKNQDACYKHSRGQIERRNRTWDNGNGSKSNTWTGKGNDSESRDSSAQISGRRCTKSQIARNRVRYLDLRVRNCSPNLE